MKEKLTIVKVGGKIVETPDSLHLLLNDFRKVEGKKLLVHGGGRSATAMAAKLGIETIMVEGRRVTDDKMLEVVTMVYAGLVNKKIVAQLQARNINAVGLTGADMGIVRSEKRPVKTVDYGWVGDVKGVDAKALATLINADVCPVIAPLTHDGYGQLLNTNADTMAAETAKALAKLYDVTLMFCFEKAGVLADENDDNSVIPTITPAVLADIKQRGIVSGGMLPKLDNAMDCVEAGVTEVLITRADHIADPYSGTKICL